MDPVFFATAGEWHDWLLRHHASEWELLVGYYKRSSGRPGMTWPESVDAALCFGWIDGVRRRIDDLTYSIRFTPRKPRSIWSAVNVKRANELAAQNLMHDAGLRAFAARQAERSGIYSFEQEKVAFTREQEKAFRAQRSAWRFFSAQAAWYQRAATWWVVSAKQEATRERRLATLIADSASERTLRHLTRNVVR